VSTNILGGRYRITEKIGSGGMADVYKAIDETLGRTVAVKVMHSKYASDESFTARFKQEAQAAANLQSPNIVNIYDWGQEGNYYYIVMEYVRGTDLKTLIRQKGALPSRQVAEIGAQVCNALTVAHGYDIIHRDIKPHNIMVTPDGMVKVMDFGIARVENTTMTQTGSVLGTAHYVSPEQAQGRELTNASDLYSLGVVLYELASGKLPFDGETPVAVALKQVNEQAQRPSKFNPDIDPRLEDVIGRAMSKDPRTRYATADEMRADLQRIAGGSSPLDATTVLAGSAVAAGTVGAHDATTVLSGPDGTGTTVMPAVGGQPGVYGGPDGGQLGHVGPAPKKKSKTPMILVTIIGLLLVGAALAFAIYNFSPSIQGVEVPSVTEKPLQEAITTLTEAGFVVGTPKEKHDPKIEKGRVISQDPKGGSRAELGSTVVLTVSLGKEMGTVPDIVGLTEALAQDALREAGFEPDPQPGTNSSTIAAGAIISQDPIPGTELEKGSRVAYVPSLGAEIVEVPSVIGLDVATAEANLIAAGFLVTITDDYSDEIAAGLVISQNPGAATRVEKGSTVTIVKSLGKKDVVIPIDFTGQSADTAEANLKALGLVVERKIQYTNSNTNKGKVISQSAAAGTSVPAGSTIELIVDGGIKPS